MKFEEMSLKEELLKAIKHLGFTEPTPIQASCIPKVMEGKDVIGQSLTGSGKTAAFGLPILGRLVAGNGIQMLVLTPTRELCQQVRDHLDQMAKFLPLNIYAIYGGVGYFQQYEDIKNAEVIVATPGRLLDHIKRGTIHFKDVKFIVLDEADKMLEMGFEEDVEEIIKHTPKERQTVFFSATMPAAALRLIHKYMKSPVLIKEKLQVDRSLLRQTFYDIGMEKKFSLLVKLLKDTPAASAIVFCGTKRNVDKVTQALKRIGIKSMAVHGDLPQSRRLQAVNFLKEGKIDVLVATDVAARGLDIKDITHIYNYDVPRTPEEYTHRIGRTARAGRKGEAVTLLAERDYKNFESILRDKTMNIIQMPIPQLESVPLQREHYEGTTYRPHQRRDHNYGPAPGTEGEAQQSAGQQGDVQPQYHQGHRHMHGQGFGSQNRQRYGNERRRERPQGGTGGYPSQGRGGYGGQSRGQESGYPQEKKVYGYDSQGAGQEQGQGGQQGYGQRQGNRSGGQGNYSQGGGRPHRPGNFSHGGHSKNKNFRPNRNRGGWQ